MAADGDDGGGAGGGDGDGGGAPVMKTAPARRPVRVVEAPPLLPLVLALLFSMEVVLEQQWRWMTAAMMEMNDGEYDGGA